MTAVPLLLVTGFLGAGKTSFINRVLMEADGTRIAAIVNDFGSINIDAELVAGAADGSVGLANGCICCSLQGDLLRTLRTVLTHGPRPDAIVVEASGVADPRGIITPILDPVLWNSVRLDAVICIVDAWDCVNEPGRLDDPLWLAQYRLADFVILSKAAGLDAAAVEALKSRLAELAAKPLFDGDRAALPMDVIFPAGERTSSASRFDASEPVDTSRFVTVEWSSPAAVSEAAFGTALNRIAPGLLRAKGFLRFREKAGRSFLLQLVGRRATFAPAAEDSDGCRLVLIGEKGRFDPIVAKAELGRLADMTDMHSGSGK